MDQNLRKLAAAGTAAAVSIAALAVVGTDSGNAQPRPMPPGEKLTMVFVFDGLRPDSINPTDTPNLHRLRESGTEFTDSHASVPTVTRVNSPAIGTGNFPATNGLTGNSMFVPAVSTTAPFSNGNAEQLTNLDLVTGGRMLTSTSLGERLHAAGRSVVAIGSGTSGSTLLLNPRAPRGVGKMINIGDVTPARPFTYPASLGDTLRAKFGDPPRSGGIAKVNYHARVLREHLLTEDRPDVILNWFTEPDGSQHEHGAGSPQALEGIRNDDRNVGEILHTLRDLGLIQRTNIIIASDHGFSLYDSNVDVEGELIKAGLKAGKGSDDVVVANTGSVAIHVKDHDRRKTRAIAEWLQEQPWTDTIYTKRRGRLQDGWVPGTFSLEVIHHDHPTRAPDVLVTLPWTNKPNRFGVRGTATNAGGPVTGDASGHGSFSPWDIRSTLIAWGADFRDGAVSHTPAGNVDITPTLLRLLHIRGGEPTDGRPLVEALNGGPRVVPFRKRTFTQRRGRYAATVSVSEVARTRYVDQSRRTR